MGCCLSRLFYFALEFKDQELTISIVKADFNITLHSARYTIGQICRLVVG